MYSKCRGLYLGFGIQGRREQSQLYTLILYESKLISYFHTILAKNVSVKKQQSLLVIKFDEKAKLNPPPLVYSHSVCNKVSTLAKRGYTGGNFPPSFLLSFLSLLLFLSNFNKVSTPILKTHQQSLSYSQLSLSRCCVLVFCSHFRLTQHKPQIASGTFSQFLASSSLFVFFLFIVFVLSLKLTHFS